MRDLIERQAAIDVLKKISFSHWFECGEYLSEDTREIEIISSNKALEEIEALPTAQPNLQPTCNQLATVVKDTNVPCKDTISRTEAIDAISNWLYDTQTTKTSDEVLLKLPSAQTEPQWIPVSERLPEERGFYLVKVCAEYRPIRIYAFSPWDMDKERKFWINDSDSHSHVFNHFVEAWMPLPEPYRAERRTDDLQ